MRIRLRHAVFVALNKGAIATTVAAMMACGGQMLGGWTAAAQTAGDTAVQSASIKTSTQDGVYTEEQANRGQARYMRVCVSCHHKELQGDWQASAPPLAGRRFVTTWENETLESLFDKIRTTMPFEDPGSLTLQDSIDLVAFILKVNRMPAGVDELMAEPDALRRIVITSTPNDGR